MQASEFQESQSENIDIKEQFFKYLDFLHWIVLGAIIALSLAFFYLRYAQETYQAYNVIKILDNKNAGFKMPTDALSFFSNNKINLENEQEVLQSSLLIAQVVDALDLQNSYSIKGTIRETEMGPTAPIYISWNQEAEKTNELQIEVALELTSKDYYFEDQKELKAYGTSYTFKNNSFSIHLKEGVQKDSISGVYKIKKSTKEKTILTIKNQLTVEHIGKQSEMGKLTVTAFHPQTAANIANKLAEVFNQDGITDRQLVHKKTIDFVNERFDFLFRELDSIESKKAVYKQGQRLADFQADAGVLLGAKTATDGELNQAKTQAVISDILIETLSKTKPNELLPANIGLEQMEVATLTNQYNELVLQQQKMLKTVGENHPAIIELQATQKGLKANLKTSLDTYKKVL